MCQPDVTSTNYSISEIVLHPEYGFEKHLNDISLIKIATLLQFGSHVSPVCLPTPGLNYVGQVSTIATWIHGNFYDGVSHKSCEPKKLGLPVLDQSHCPIDFSDSQGCVGIEGVPNVLCGVSEIYSNESFK